MYFIEKNECGKTKLNWVLARFALGGTSIGALRNAIVFTLSLGLAWLTVSKGASLGEKVSNKNETERGRYLVGEVAKCIV
jgi:hypothetical protein